MDIFNNDPQIRQSADAADQWILFTKGSAAVQVKSMILC